MENSPNGRNEEDYPQEEEMRRTIRFWRKKEILHLRSNCGALLKRNSSGIPFLVDSTRGGNEEDSPFSVDKRSPPLEEDKRKVE